jgi:hypothetical protein
MTRAAAYEILGLEVGASSEDVVLAHRRLVREWHPDLFPFGEQRSAAEERLKIINAARDRLLEIEIPHAPEEEIETESEAAAPPPPEPEVPADVYVVLPEPATHFQASERFLMIVGCLLLVLIGLVFLIPDEEPTDRGMDSIFAEPLRADVPTIFSR